VQRGAHAHARRSDRPLGRSPPLVIALLIAALALYVNSTNPFFPESRNINGALFLATALGFASLAQLIAVLSGGIDLAVGPLAGVVVVVLSFFAGARASTGSVISGLLLAPVISVGVGLVHGLLIRKVKLSPVVTTLATYIALQGVSLTLPPTPIGYIGPDLASVLEQRLGPIPAVFVVLTCAAVAVVAEILLRRTRPGIGLRAVGSDEVSARRLGAPVDLLVIGAYVGAAIFAGAAGVLLTAQVGIGDPTDHPPCRRSQLRRARHERRPASGWGGARPARRLRSGARGAPPPRAGSGAGPRRQGRLPLTARRAQSR